MGKSSPVYFFSAIAVALAVGFFLGAFSASQGAGMLINYYDDNTAPVASFTFTPDKPAVSQTVNFDASSSYDPDGTIKTYTWKFGDGTSITGRTANKAFSAAGTYNVTLTVTDYFYASAAVTKSVVVTTAPATGNTTANKMPVASFVFSPPSPAAGSQVKFNASASYDPDGTIASYNWIFSDKTTATGKITYKTFASAGTYKANLTVTDNKGAKSAVATKTIIVAASTISPNTTTNNTLPVARFTYKPNIVYDGYLVTFDASTSSDADGTISSYQWAFGDGLTGTGKVAYHTYTLDSMASSVFTAKLTVTDNKGGKAITSKSITIYPAY